jgi:hypothetical protein
VVSEQFALRKQELRQLKADLDAQARFLQREVANNAELDAQIAAADREVGSLAGIAGGCLLAALMKWCHDSHVRLQWQGPPQECPAGSQVAHPCDQRRGSWALLPECASPCRSASSVMW